MTYQPLLEAINVRAREWHDLTCELSNRPVSGDRRVWLKIVSLEELLDSFWERRRRLLALAYARSLSPDMLVERFQGDCRSDLLHVAPVC